MLIGHKGTSKNAGRAGWPFVSRDWQVMPLRGV